MLCIAGKNNIAVDCLYYAMSIIPKSEICVVLNKNDNNKNSWQKSLGFHATLESIPIKSLEEVQGIDDLIFLSLEFDSIIRPDLFKSKRLFNIHFSLLPEYKGMFTSLLPILHGKDYSGVTLHRIDRGIDTGEIIGQKAININDLTSRQLYTEYLKHGTELVFDNLTPLIENTIKSFSQNSLRSTYYSKRSFDFNQKEIPSNQTAFQIYLFVNALAFRVYQMPIFNGCEIFKAEILKTKSTCKPGTIVRENIHQFEVATIDYNIILYKDYYSEIFNCCKTDDIKKASQIVGFIDNINECDQNGWTPLIVACYHGATQVVRLLLDNGANPHLTNLNGTTTLMYAKDSFLSKRDFGVIELLLSQNVDVEATDIYGKNVFDYTDDNELSDYLRSYDKIS